VIASNRNCQDFFEVTDNDELDSGLLALVQSVLEPGVKPQAEVQTETKTETGPEPEIEPESEPVAELAEPVDDSKPEAAPAISNELTRERSAEELAAIILNALRTLDGSPKEGFTVTVYGANPWNAMLTITPAAGAIKDAPLWRERVKEMAIRLRQYYDLVEPD
jgi:hypothetical protein